MNISLSVPTWLVALHRRPPAPRSLAACVEHEGRKFLVTVDLNDAYQPLRVEVSTIKRSSVIGSPAEPDWDALAEQHGVPVAAGGGGLEMCAGCGCPVDATSAAVKVVAGNLAKRIGDGCPHPAGKYLCAECSAR
jgi:hypothetical protein